MEIPFHLLIPGQQISLASGINQSHYLRHANYQFWAHGPDQGTGYSDLMRKDATFIISAPNNGAPGFVSLQSANYPNHFLRHANYRFLLSPFEDSRVYRDDSAFRIIPAANGDPSMVSLVSANFPDMYVSTRPHAREEVWLERFNPYDNLHVCWRVKVPLVYFGAYAEIPLTSLVPGQVVSFATGNNRYLRHANSEGWAHGPDQGCDYSPLMRADATFYVSPPTNGTPGYVSLQSHNYPGSFLRHCNYRILLSRYENTPVFSGDSSFRVIPAINGDPTMVSFVSANINRERGQEDHYICTSKSAPDQVWLSTVNRYDMADTERACWRSKFALLHYGAQLPVTLTAGQRISLSNSSGCYLRHANSQGFAHGPDQGPGRFSDLMRKDATFTISPANNGQPGHVSLQASNYPGHFLRHANYQFWLHPSDHTPLFADDSTFRVVPALNGNPSCVSFLSYNFSCGRGKQDHYICVKQDARDQVWLSAVNVSDMRDLDRACWSVNWPLI